MLSLLGPPSYRKPILDTPIPKQMTLYRIEGVDEAAEHLNGEASHLAEED